MTFAVTMSLMFPEASRITLDPGRKKKKKKLKPRLFSKDQNFFVVGGNAGSFHENICIESFLFYFILINMFSSNSNAFFVG